MSRAQIVLGSTILGVIAILLGLAGWETYSSSVEHYCSLCQREIHDSTRTIGHLPDGTLERYCCPTCALNAQIQSGHKIEITRLSDFQTASPLSPKDAYVVRGSGINICTKKASLINSAKQSSPLDFDRCSPSILAFADRTTARKFEREHGGSLMRFGELASLYRLEKP